MPLIEPKDPALEPTRIGSAPADEGQPSEDQAASNPTDAEDPSAVDAGDEGDQEVVEGASDDEVDDAGEAAKDVPGLQKKLREAAKARKALQAAQEENARLRAQADAFQVLLKNPNAEQLLRDLRKNGMLPGANSGSDSQAEPADFIPKSDYGFEEKTDQGLRRMLNDGLGAMLSKLKSELAPVAQEVNISRESRREAEWKSLVKGNPQLDKYKTDAYALAQSKGLGLDEALLLASKGKSALLNGSAKAAAVAAKTPVLSSRGASSSAVNRLPEKSKSLKHAFEILQKAARQQA